MKPNTVIDTHSMRLAKDTYLITRFHVNGDYVVYRTHHLTLSSSSHHTEIQLDEFKLSSPAVASWEEELKSKEYNVRSKVEEHQHHMLSDTPESKVLVAVQTVGLFTSLKQLRKHFSPKMSMDQLLPAVVLLMKTDKLMYDKNNCIVPFRSR